MKYQQAGLINLLFVLIAVPAFAKPITWESHSKQFGSVQVQVSSQLAAVQEHTFGPQNAYNDNDKKAWCVSALRPAQWIKLTFQKKQKFATFYVDNGFDKDPTIYRQYGRVKLARITLSNGKSYQYKLNDSPKAMNYRLPHPFEGHWIKLTILSTYPGTRYQATCLDGFNIDFQEYGNQ